MWGEKLTDFSGQQKTQRTISYESKQAVFPGLLALFSLLCYYSRQDMTNYHLTAPTTLPSLAVQEAKEKRRKVLAAVRQRRAIIYQRFREKMQLQASNNLATMA